MIGRRHDQIKRRLRAGMLDREPEKIFIIHAPFFVQSVRNHLISAVDFVESLLAAEFADPLPTEISAVKKPWLVAELFEYRRGCGWQSLAHDRLEIHKGAREWQSGNDYAEAFNRTDAR